MIPCLRLSLRVFSDSSLSLSHPDKSGETISGIASSPSAPRNDKYKFYLWRLDELQTEDFFASFSVLDSIINAPAYYLDDLLRITDVNLRTSGNLAHQREGHIDAILSYMTIFNS